MNCMRGSSLLVRSFIASCAIANWIAVAALASQSQPANVNDAQRFDSPEAAVKALVEAAKSGEKGALGKIFGSIASELLSGDEVQDRADMESFARDLNAANKLVKNDDGTMTLKIGRKGHPFAVPLVQKDGKWFFDTAAGKEEILNRRIGDNELKTIAVCRGYVVAQREYAETDRDGDDVIEYAQVFASAAGKRDGLFWETQEGEPPSPLGPLVVEARAEGYAKGDGNAEKPRPYHGYVYKILKKQGGGAPGGAFDYTINGHMIAGFALLAYPIDWQNSGVMTFQVNANGKVYQKDLGEKSAEIAGKIDTYEIDPSWSVVTD